MFDATIKADRLEAFTDYLTPLVDECKLHLDETELHTRACDAANVGMADVSLGDSAFESYQADGGLIGIDLTRFEDIISMADSGQLMHLSLNEETRKLEIEIEGLEYTLALIDPDAIRQEPDIPDLELDCEVVIEGSDIQRAVKAADLVSDHVAIGSNPDDRSMYFDADGDTDDVTITLGDEDVIDAECPAEVKSLFSLDYLKDMAKPIGSTDEVRVQFGDEFPTKLHTSFAAGEGEVTYLLAPRIQS